MQFSVQHRHVVITLFLWDLPSSYWLEGEGGGGRRLFLIVSRHNDVADTYNIHSCVKFYISVILCDFNTSGSYNGTLSLSRNGIHSNVLMLH